MQAAGVPRRTSGPCNTRVRPPVAVRTVGRLVAATGAINVVAAVVPPERARLRMVTEVVPAVGVQTAHAATAAIGLLLIYLGVGLRRGNREAWFVAVTLAAASVLLNLVKSLDVDAAAISAALLALLIAVRSQFRAAASRPAGGGRCSRCSGSHRPGTSSASPRSGCDRAGWRPDSPRACGSCTSRTAWSA